MSETEGKMGLLIGVVVMVVLGAVLYPLIGDRVSEMTNESDAAYVGDDSAALVGMIPIFYWLAIALTVIGVAVVAIRTAL